MNVGELLRHPIGHHLLFAAGVDEQQVFLTVVEKAEVALAIPLRRTHDCRLNRRLFRHRMSLFDRWNDDLTFRRRDVAMSVHERTDTVKRLGRYAAAVA